MMTLRGTASVAMILALGLGGCAAMKTGRDRIVKAPPRCADQTVEVYFDAESAEVTKEGRAVIAAAAREGRPCKVAGVDVLGLSDSAGGADANLELSKRRAQSVTAALAAAGLPAGEFKVQAAGQAGSLTAGGQARPLRRRVDVVLHLSPG
ncbi:OmpA family protein [Phenylobacterium sp.]|jgi:peptidoglycan-associated lipoprotein|uniref:OmpA family protein n=1 Tax=Phenylobacterium sp. TaxID=1871053 RepID=UPI0026249095|nr:OmpA family protein [Phenylobacterium sp.]